MLVGTLGGRDFTYAARERVAADVEALDTSPTQCFSCADLAEEGQVFCAEHLVPHESIGQWVGMVLLLAVIGGVLFFVGAWR